MTELIGAPKPPAEITDADINTWVAQQVMALQAQLPAQVQKMHRSGKYTLHQINTFKAGAIREVTILESILKKLVTPPPSQSGCQWKQSVNGGFEVHVYVSKVDMENIRLPTDDAELFESLMEKNQSVGVLSAMAMLFGHWEKQRQKDEKELIASIEAAGSA